MYLARYNFLKRTFKNQGWVMAYMAIYIVPLMGLVLIKWTMVAVWFKNLMKSTSKSSSNVASNGNKAK
jgi:hypothetical protein